MSLNPVAPPEGSEPLNDLGPLVWVIDEIRKSLDGSIKAMRRFVRDAELARGSGLTELDASHLRIARQQLHQAVGALEMVGLEAPAKLLRAMEVLAQKFVQRPEQCSDEAATRMERAGFALIEFLEGVLKGKTASPVALFPQYSALMGLSSAERVHPADLWPVPWRWQTISIPESIEALAYSADVRSIMDRAILNVVKSADPQAAKRLSAVCLRLAAGQAQPHPRTFWAAASGFFEAQALRKLPQDIYTKRTASRVLQQYASLSKGEAGILERLAQDLVFFCSLAAPETGNAFSALQAVRQAYGLDEARPVNYTLEQFGRFDPAQLVLARKRIASAAETWSALAGGDVHRIKLVTEQFAAVAESITKMHSESAELAQALIAAVDVSARSGAAPTPAVAMEVATTILYLEAAYEDLDPTDNHMAERGAILAARLRSVAAGAESEPMEGWMEDLYRRVSDRQTMGSVMGELRAALAGVEKSLDQFFRDPTDKSPLREVPNQLSQMRGVFSVLGLDQPSIAALRMRSSVEQFLVDDIDVAAARTGIFEKLGNSLGAMGFLIDMLSYQRSLAKTLFVYDESAGEFRSLMGRESREVVPPEAPRAEPAHESTVAMAGSALPSVPEVAVASSAAVTPAVSPPTSHSTPASSPPSTFDSTVKLDTSKAVPESDDDDAELLDIFLDEAREVIARGMEAVNALRADASNLAEQTTLRRAFHTLKGSSRMVGLTDFGEAAWSFEQMLNASLAEHKPAAETLIALSSSAMAAFERWVNAIAAHAPAEWSSEPFRASSDGWRLGGQHIELQVPGEAVAPPETADAVADAVPELDFDFASPAPEVAVEPQPLAAAEQAPEPSAAESDGQNEEVTDDEVLALNNALHRAPEVPEASEDADASEAMPDFTSTQTFDVSGGHPDHVPDFQATQTFEALDLKFPESRAQAAPPPPPAQILQDIGDFDFSAMATQAQPAVDAAPAEQVAESGADLDALLPIELDFPQDAVAPQEAAASPESAETGDATAETADTLDDSTADGAEHTKVIGPLRLSIPLYNVYLNEADEWSRHLQTDLNEWGLELHRPLPDSAIALAHSLAGSSATVGFTALSGLARSLESALHHVHLHDQGNADHAMIFNNAAEEIRRLLHQFAAGFLKEPDAALMEALQSIIDMEFPEPAELQASDDDTDAAEVDLPSEFVDSSSYVDERVPADEAAVAADSALSDVAETNETTETSASEDIPDLDAVDTKAPDLEEAVPAAVHSAPSQSAPSQTPVAAAAPLRLADAAVGHIDAVDHFDHDLLPIFEEEAAELMPALSTALRQWVSRPENLSARGEVMRVLHTLKGSARLAGAMRLGEMAHRMESGIEELGTEGLQTVQLEPLLSRFDELQNTLRQILEPTAPAEVTPVAKEAAAAAAEEPAARAAEVPVANTVHTVAAPMEPVRSSANQSIRVRSQLLDRMVNQAGEVMISRSRMESRIVQLKTSLQEMDTNLERLRQQLRDVELQAETQMQSRLALTKDAAKGFDPLEFDRFTRVQELTRMMAESVNDVATVQRGLQRAVQGAEDDLVAQGRQARELQRDLLRTRMVEFEGISERLYGVVRQASKESGKQVKLDIVGGSIEMDRGVLDRMTPAFEHLLRNAVGHGIEAPQVRSERHKPAVGTITITVQQMSNDVTVSFRDDGGGLPLERIRAKAIANGLIDAKAELTPEQAANLVFMPGFSTADKVTELSGRGIGMDVVRSEVNALGGRIETMTQAEQGSEFKLVLPLTTAVTQVVMLRLGDFTIGVPSNLMETVLRAPAQAVEQAYASHQYDVGGESVPFYWAGALLQTSARSVEVAGRTAQVAIFRSAGQRLAVHVDEVLGNREVVVKNLGPQLARLPGLAGMSVLPSGAVVLIYNPVALATVYGEQARALSDGQVATAKTDSGATADSQGQVPLILVVDDSITVRRVTQRLLKREGYRVVTANDGLQALEKLQEERPNVVLSDIEMPRMDGFDLVRNIRADEALRDLPVIMITSRIAEKHREHARELGVNHYLGKPYSEEELLGLVRSYCEAVATS